MAAEDIRNIVDRCYIVGSSSTYLVPNALDGSNPASASLGLGSTSSGPTSTPTPPEVIATLVGRCYAGTPVNIPNPLDGQNPRIPAVVDPPEITPTPAQVIQDLVGRCYPGLPPLQQPFDIPEVDDESIEIDLPFFDWITDIIPDLPWDGGKLIIKTPYVGDPSSWISIGDPPPEDSDCNEVFKLKVRNQVEYLGNNKWRNRNDGTILLCKGDNRDQDLPWERCVRNTLDCYFKPYVGGRWTPPKQSCDAYYPNNWSANRDRVCVKNCFPPRQAIYQTYSGGKHTYSKTNNGTEPAFYVSRDPVGDIDDNPITTPLFYYINSSGDGFLTTNPGLPDSPGAGERNTMNSNGMVFQEVIGYVFQAASEMISYMGDGEKAEALWRYYNGSNHFYTMDPEMLWDQPQQKLGRNAYRIPKTEVFANLMITMDTEKGSAGYDNALAYYMADENGPDIGVILVPSAQNGSNINRVTITKSMLNDYNGGSMGFALIPDGGDRNSLSAGQQISFSSQSDGFRADGINTAEGNYCLFSDRQWNPGDKDFTKWKGRNRQMWEDLINGDDDYDDLKFWHLVQWEDNGYYLEGKQCFVYDQDKPLPIYKIIEPSTCDNRGLEKSFKDVTLARTGCGTNVPTVLPGNDTDWECARCTGSYAVKLNQNQSISAKNSVTYRIVSMGGITGGLDASCMKFKFRFKKNNITFYEKSWEAAHWPVIGDSITSTEVSLSAGDTLQFELVNIENGPHIGTVSPTLALYNVAAGSYDHMWSLNLSTVSSDDKIASTSTGMPWANPIADNTGGAITGMGMCFNPYNQRPEVWRSGSQDGDSYYRNDDGYDFNFTEVWANSTVIPMGGSLEASPTIMGNHPRTDDNRFMPDLPGGYIDTGYVEKNLGVYEMANTHIYRKNTGCYNKLLESYLVTRMEGVSSSLMSAGLEQTIPTAYANRMVPWYEFGSSGASDGLGYLNAINSQWRNGPASDNYFSPCTFIHDYVLDGKALSGASNVTAAAKIRVGITFYPTRIPGSNARTRTTYFWQAMIHVIDVIAPGFGYQERMEFDLMWPPERDSDYENSAITPYYPNDSIAQNQLPKKKIINWYENTKSVRRVAKEMVYQESHNRSSPIWYFCSDRNRDRLRFKIIVTGVS